MRDPIKSIGRFRADDRGVTAVEYAVIAGVLVGAIGIAFTTLGTTLQTFFSGFAL